MQTRKTTTLPCTQLSVAEGNFDFNRLFPINKIVLHTAVGTITSANTRFNQNGSLVSAHYGIEENGQIYQWCDEDIVAYANGNYAINQSAISIEHGDHGDYNGTRPDALYASSSKLVAELCKFYDIPCDRQHVIKHLEVPFPTACPDALDVEKIVRGALAILTPTSAEPLVCDPVSVRDMLVSKASSFDEVAALWQLSDSERKAPGAGKWIVEQIKQLQTVNLALKGQLLRVSEPLQSSQTGFSSSFGVSTSSTPSNPVSNTPTPNLAGNMVPIQAKHMSLLEAFLSVFWKL